jgi:hypothetical protein
VDNAARRSLGKVGIVQRADNGAGYSVINVFSTALLLSARFTNGAAK